MKHYICEISNGHGVQFSHMSFLMDRLPYQDSPWITRRSRSVRNQPRNSRGRRGTTNKANTKRASHYSPLYEIGIRRLVRCAGSVSRSNRTAFYLPVGGLLAGLFNCPFVRGPRTSSEGTTGWLAAIRDPKIGSALAAIHRHPGDAWSIEELAKIAGSCLAQCFAIDLPRSSGCRRRVTLRDGECIWRAVGWAMSALQWPKRRSGSVTSRKRRSAVPSNVSWVSRPARYDASD